MVNEARSVSGISSTFKDRPGDQGRRGGCWPPALPMFAGIILIAIALPALWIDSRAFFAAWLATWWCCLGFVLGALVNAFIHRLTGGLWGIALRPVTLALSRRMPWIVLLGLPLIAGATRLYPWAADPAGWAHELSRPAFVKAWLSPGFVLARVAVYGVVWCVVSRPAMLATRGTAAAGLGLIGVFTSLAAVDLLMSLVPGWYSTAFGLVTLSAQALGGTVLSVAWLAGLAPARVPTPDKGKPPVWRDLGNLMLMWTMLWAYLAFMEFLIIWAEDLPHEIAWFLPRLQTGWRWIGLALVVLQLAVPLLCLLMRSLKDDPRRLGRLAAFMLAMQAVQASWLVLPSVVPHSLLGWWLVPALLGGMGLLMFGGLPASLSREVAHVAA